MNTILQWARRLWYLLNRSRFDEALREEMAAHRAMMAEPARFGNTLRLREESADVWGWRWLDQLAQDARFGGRVLIRNPGFSSAAIITLALATGATTAIFSVVNSVLLRPLPFSEPDSLVEITGRNWREAHPETEPDPLTGPIGSAELEEYQRQSRSFDGFAGHGLTTRHLGGAAGPERLTAVQADLNLFDVLGVGAIAGRTFRPGDPSDVAVISANLWERRFGRDPTIPGRTVSMDGKPTIVLGVMPEWFQFPYGATSLTEGALSESRTDVWVPAPALRASDGALRRGRVAVVARVKPGVGLDSAATELRVIAARLQSQAQSSNPHVRVGVRVTSLSDVVLGRVRRSLWILFAAVGLVLAAACANVANLLLARMTIRMREVATRASLGAGRFRIVRQFLVESLLLSLAGGLLGALIARWGTGVLVARAAAKIPRAHEISLDWRAFLFLLLACVAAAVAFGLAPALIAARTDLNLVAKEAGGSVTSARRYQRLRSGLVVIEVALAFMLAIGAALVMREVVRLQHVDTGMVTENVVTFHVTPKAAAQDYYAIAQRLDGFPRVLAAGFTQLVPLQNWGWEAGFSIVGRPSLGQAVAGLRYVTPGYFEALGIPILRGRPLTDRDTADAPLVILVNDALARRYFPNEDPVGHALDRGRIVGVVGNVRQAGLDSPAEPEIYYPAAQNVTMASDIGMTLVVRTAGPPEAVVDPIRSIIHDVNPALAVFNIRKMDRVVKDSLWELNLYRWLVGLFAGLSILLAAIGLYGLISYSVTARMREFAVRLALGSDPAKLARRVFLDGAGLVTAGLVAGLLLALAAGPVLRSINRNLNGDPVTYGSVAVLLILIGLAACVLPAVRVVGVNPASALRHE